MIFYFLFDVVDFFPVPFLPVFRDGVRHGYNIFYEGKFFLGLPTVVRGAHVIAAVDKNGAV